MIDDMVTLRPSQFLKDVEEPFQKSRKGRGKKNALYFKGRVGNKGGEDFQREG